MGCALAERAFIATDNYGIALHLTDEKAGNINVHFPRARFNVIPAESKSEKLNYFYFVNDELIQEKVK